MQMILKPQRHKSLARRHPWVYSGAVAQVQGSPQLGDTIRVTDNSGGFLAWAAYSPYSQIRARVWSWDPAEIIDEAFFRARLHTALALRQALFVTAGNNALRLVHGESDAIPGFVLDRYGDTLVTQFWTAGAEHWRQTLAKLALELTGAASLYDRSDVDGRKLEGLPETTGLLGGADPPAEVEIEENGLHFRVDVRGGHKTGYYLDQRLNRLRVRELAQGRDVLDCFSYTGGFTCNALLGGAKSVIALDASASALAQAKAHVALNELPGERVEWLEGDVFKELRTFRDARRTFDLIVLDPPKFAHTAAQAQRAARGYKDINLLALKLLRPGGILCTFSCSGGIDENLFQKIVAGAALDAGVDARIVDRLYQSPDHPVALNFPEGAYLKGLVVFVA